MGYGANLLEPKALFALAIIPVVRLPNRVSTIGVNLDAPGNLMLPRHSAFHFMAGVKISLRCAINATQASQARVRCCTAERVAFGTVVHFGPLGQLGGRVEWKFTLAQRPLVPVKHCHRAALCRLSPQQRTLRH